MVHVAVKDLPASVRQVLKLVNYGSRDIAIRPSESVVVRNFGGAGHRGFFVVFALDGSIEPKVSYGSWGGPNPYETCQVDVDDRPHPIPPGGAVLLGSDGGGVYATLHVHPSNMAPMLPIRAELTERQRSILKQYWGLTSAGRKYEWENYPGSKPTTEELDALVALKLLARNRAGAVSITTEGKNNVRT